MLADSIARQAGPRCSLRFGARADRQRFELARRLRRLVIRTILVGAAIIF
jgi:hypothetical protein